MKKGLSFTLTLVVVGVILLMTALSVITLGGSSINAFFETIGGQQEEAIQEAAIREACNEKMNRINRNYCNLYVQTHAYDGGSEPGSYSNYDRTNWADNEDCATTSQNQQSRGYTAAQEQDPTGYAFERSASDEGCSWVDNYGQVDAPTVSVEGQTFDCVAEGMISDVQCPADQ